MTDKKKSLLKSSMFYGLLLGGFWVVKYIFFILGTLFPAIDLVSVIFAPLTCVFAYIFTRVYKIGTGGIITFSQAWRFGVLLFFFAALIESLPQYIFFQHIASPEYLANMLKQTETLIDMMKLAPQMKSDIIAQIAAIKPIDLAIQGIFTNIIYGIIISIPVAAILCRGVENLNITTESDE